jgi:hypothetical protein
VSFEDFQLRNTTLVEFESCPDISLSRVKFGGLNGENSSIFLKISETKKFSIQNITLATSQISASSHFLQFNNLEHILIQNATLGNNTLSGVGSQFIIIKDSKIINMNSLSLYSNKIYKAIQLIKIHSTLILPESLVDIVFVSFKNNICDSSYDEASHLVEIELIESVVLGEMEFDSNFFFKNLLIISKASSKIVLSKIQFRNCWSETAVNIIGVDYVDINNCGFFKNNLQSTKSTQQPRAGPSILIKNFKTLMITSLTIEDSVAFSNPTGVILINEAIESDTKISDFLCVGNKVMGFEPDSLYSSNCLYFSQKGRLTLEKIKMYYNTIAFGGGNNCLNSDSSQVSLTIDSAQFIGNEASRESVCLKFYGLSVNIKNSVFL